MARESGLIVPNSPRDLDLEFDDWREHRRDAVQAIVDAFAAGTKYVLLSAPTGSGKTVTGSAIARTLAGQAIFLSHTIHLQNQQLRTLPRAVTATGRANHACLKPGLLEEKLTADDAPCPCEFAAPGGCSYYQQWFDCAEADEVVLNYAYAVRVVKARGLKTADGTLDNPFVGRELMVCDEGHFLEGALLAADTVEVYRNSFERFGIPMPSENLLSPETWVVWAEEHRVRLANRSNEAAEAVRAGNLDLRREAKQLRSCLTTMDNLGQVDRQDTPYFVGRTSYGYQVRPLWAWSRAQYLLFRHSPSVLIMSATLGNPNLLARLLGMQNWQFIEVPSTFPVGNRPVLYWPVCKMRHGMPDSERIRQVQALIALARKFPNQPGVVHSGSYKLAMFLIEGVNSMAPDVAQRVVGHRAGQRNLVEAFEDHQGMGNAILISPSVSTGVDWDFVDWQMIPKVPFPDLGDDIVRLRRDYVTPEGDKLGQEVYQQEAALAIVQAAGRCVRTPTSRGVTVVTDGAFWPLFKYTAPASFPSWFREAVEWYVPPEVEA